MEGGTRPDRPEGQGNPATGRRPLTSASHKSGFPLTMSSTLLAASLSKVLESLVASMNTRTTSDLSEGWRYSAKD